MGLKVWLPLNSDLRNLGTSNLAFTNGNTTSITVSDAGLPGACYQRETAKSAGRIISDNTINLDGDLTICCWAKVTASVGSDTANGLVTNHSFSSTKGYGFGLNIKHISDDDYRICCSTGTGTSRTYNVYYGTTNIKDAWHHLALTYDNTKHEFKLWVDGVVELTQSHTNASAANKVGIFAWSVSSTSTSYYPACMLNDVRIYDQCLSAAEIHELSKGLIRHYKLDNFGYGFDDLLVDGATPKTVTLSGDNAYTGWYNFKAGAKNGLNTKIRFHIEFDYSVDESLVTTTNAQLYAQINGSIITATSFNLSSDGYEGHKSFYFYMSSTQASATTYRIRFRVRYANAGVSYTISNVTLRLAYMEDMAGIVNDSSGYGYHGTIEGTRSFVDSARYSLASYMNNTESKTDCIVLPGLPSTIKTVSFWAKLEDNDHAQILVRDPLFQVSCNKASEVIYTYPSKKAGYTYSSAGFEYGKWLHFVVLTSGSAYQLYINGTAASTGSASNNYAHSGTTSCWLLNRRYPSGSAFGAKAAISDFRVYATTLSEADILELYHTGMKIGKQHDIHTYELVEAKNKIGFNTIGQLQCETLDEDESVSFLSTKTVEAATFIEK